MAIFAFRKETYYVKRLTTIEKNCWKDNLTKKESLKHIVKYLNKRNFNNENHPFIVEIKEVLNKLNDDYNENELNEILRRIHTYKIKDTYLKAV